MSQTSEGAKKAYQNRLTKHGVDALREMQSNGGKASSTGGFNSNKVGEDGLTGRQRARLASAESHRLRHHSYNKDLLDGSDEQNM